MFIVKETFKVGQLAVSALEHVQSVCMNGNLEPRRCECVNQLPHDCVFQHFLDLQLVGEQQYCASLLHSHDTDTRATMNLAVGDGVIAAGQDGTCCLMRFQQCTQKEGGKAPAKDGENYYYRLKYICCHKNICCIYCTY